MSTLKAQMDRSIDSELAFQKYKVDLEAQLRREEMQIRREELQLQREALEFAAQRVEE